MELLICFAGTVLGDFLNRCIRYLPRHWAAFPAAESLGGEFDARLAGSLARRMFVMGLTGIVMIFAYEVFGFRAELLRAVFFLSFLIVVAMIDYDHQLILDKLLLLMGAAGIALSIFCAEAAVSAWSDGIIGFFLGGTLLLLIAAVSRGGMGGGDIKLAAVLGLWFGWRFILLTLLLSFLLGGIGGMGLVLSGVKGRRDYIPFAPFIAVAALISYLYGDVLMYWYMSEL